MNLITDYFVQPLVKKKSIKKHEIPQSRPALEDSSVESNLSDDENAEPYEIRKIKIRKRDPNVPDSISVEVYDTSIDEDTLSESPAIEILQNDNAACAEAMKMSSKPKKLPNKKRLRCRNAQEIDDTESSSDESLLVVKKRLKANGENTGVALPGQRRNLQKSDALISAKQQSIAVPCKKFPSASNKVNEDCVVLVEKIKLAPCFTKKKKKDDVDPEVKKARLLFLQRGLPKATRKQVQAIKAQTEEQGPFFPAIAHVQQRTSDDVWGSRVIDLPLRDITAYKMTQISWKKMQVSEKATRVYQVTSEGSKFIDEELLHKLKQVYHKVDIDGLYQSLRKQKQQLDELSSDADSEERFPVWTIKYRPGSAEIASNVEIVQKLRNWLLAWRWYGEDVRNKEKKAKKIVNGSGSSDDFVTSDDEDMEETSHFPGTACLLQGPVSSGKTALVQALAAEMSFHIVEISCSLKRSGKKMLSDIQEATQSHKIMQEVNGNSRTSSKNDNDMSVIVVEDADILFEGQDEGFVTGLHTLVSSAKRPVLLLTNDVSVPHLEKFRSSLTLQLAMTRPSLFFCCATLELISLLEGKSPPRKKLSRLVINNKFDLRRCLLELQFWLQDGGGGPRDWAKLSDPPTLASRLWWASSEILYEKPLWHAKSSPVPTNNNRFSKDKKLPHILNYLERFSICDIFGDKERDLGSELSEPRIRFRLKDSSCLNERMSTENLRQLDIMRDIETAYLVQTMYNFKTRSGTEIFSETLHSTMPYKELGWLSERRNAMAELLTIVPRNSRREQHSEYLPALRAICRAEQLRQSANTKRKNRFCHYLSSLGARTLSHLIVNCKTFPS